jgi:hypothetical protein
MLVPFALARVSSSRRLRWRTSLGASFLEIAGSAEIQPCAPMFFSGSLVSGRSSENLCYPLPSWDIFRFMVKLEAENVVEAESL